MNWAHLGGMDFEGVGEEPISSRQVFGRSDSTAVLEGEAEEEVVEREERGVGKAG